MADPAIPVAEAVDFFKWAVGVLLVVGKGLIAVVWKRMTAMERKIEDAAQLARHAKNNQSQIELGVERRFATKDDFTRLETEVRTGFERLSDKIDAAVAERRRTARSD